MALFLVRANFYIDADCMESALACWESGETAAYHGATLYSLESPERLADPVAVMHWCEICGQSSPELCPRHTREIN